MIANDYRKSNPEGRGVPEEYPEIVRYMNIPVFSKGEIVVVAGVGNKAAYLMAAGGSFRGYQIKGIGRDRTARVWYQALTTRLTSAANYVDLGDALVAACTDLAASGDLGFGHCASVRAATRPIVSASTTPRIT